MQRNKQGNGFQKLLETFPPPVRDCLQTIPQTGGMLSGQHCRAAIDALDISAEDLMLRLLPLARLYSATPVSGFQVGAVAKARMSDKAGEFALFLGANIEFQGQALTQTIHAEQSAVINAWLQGAKRIDTIIVTAAPCGYCRQFLNELEGSHDLTVVIESSEPGELREFNLIDLLPHAFGPQDLGLKAGLMDSADQQRNLDLQLPSNDPLVLKALAAAGRSYAPYTGNLAGCVLETGNGQTYAGRSAENAAFNPSLSPLHTAIISMAMDNFESEIRITRAVLVERSTSISQRAVSELLLQTVAPDVKLEYYKTVFGTN